MLGTPPANLPRPAPNRARLRGVLRQRRRSLLASLVAALLCLQTGCRAQAQSEGAGRPEASKPKRLIARLEVSPYGVVFCFDAAYSPDGKMIAFSGGYLVVVDASTHKLIHRADKVFRGQRLAWSPDGKWLAHSFVSDLTDYDIRVVRVGTWEEEVRLVRERGDWGGRGEISKGKVNAMEFSPDSRLLAAGGETGILEVWEIPSGERKHRFAGDHRVIHGVCFARGGRWLLYAGDVKGARGRMLLRELPGGEVLFRAESLLARMEPAGKFIVGYTPRDMKPPGGEPQSFWRGASWLANGAGMFGSAKLARGTPRSIAIAPNAQYAAYGGDSGFVWLWSLKTRDQVEIFDRYDPHRESWYGHSNGIEAVSFSPDGKTLMTASGEGLILFWDVSDLARSEEKR